MFISTTDSFFVTVNSTTLSVHDHVLNTKKNKDFESTISAIYAGDSFIIVGLFLGRVVLVAIDLTWEYEIYNFNHPVRSIFSCGDIFYFGADDAKIAILHIKKNSLNTGFIEDDSEIYNDTSLGLNSRIEDQFTHTVINEFFHNSPVLSVASKGDMTYVLDVKARITIYPEKFMYDFHATCMLFKKYLFASEKNLLYCRTEQSFSCILTVDDLISDFTFSKNGSLLFVKMKNNIQVFNKDLVKIRTFMVKDSVFGFDEPRNRMIIYNGLRVSYIENVVVSVDTLTEKMKDFIFEETKISERIIGEDDEEYETENRPLQTPRKKSKIEKVTATEYRGNIISDSSEEKNHYNNNLNLFEEESEYVEKMIEDIKHDVKVTIEPFISGRFSSNGVDLLCYNKTGYIIRRNNVIRVLYHRYEIPFEDFNNEFEIATLSENSILFVKDDDVLVFKSKNNWEKTIPYIKLIGISENIIVCITRDLLQIYLFSGIKVFECHIKEPLSLCIEGDKIVLFCVGQILILDSDFKVAMYQFNNLFDFCTIENDIIYFTAENSLFSIVKNAIINLMKFDGNPLCINNGHLITTKNIIGDIPSIEFYKIKCEGLFINPLLSDLEKERFLRQELNKAIKNNDDILMKDLLYLLKDESSMKLPDEIEIVKREEVEDELQSDVVKGCNYLSSDIRNNYTGHTRESTPIKTKKFNPFIKKK